MEKILTDNSAEKITVKWDGERFALARRNNIGSPQNVVIVLNPKEMMSLISFVGALGQGNKSL